MKAQVLITDDEGKVVYAEQVDSSVVDLNKLGDLIGAFLDNQVAAIN